MQYVRFDARGRQRLTSVVPTFPALGSDVKPAVEGGRTRTLTCGESVIFLECTGHLPLSIHADSLSEGVGRLARRFASLIRLQSVLLSPNNTRSQARWASFSSGASS